VKGFLGVANVGLLILLGQLSDILYQSCYLFDRSISFVLAVM